MLQLVRLYLRLVVLENGQSLMSCHVCFCHVQVVQLEDFDYVNFADAEFSSDEIEDFKKLYLGKQLPRQRASNEKLRAVGFKGPNPWAACWLERRIMNS